MHYDAIIIGAGPAGSSCAILLARAGWRVALVEKQVFPRRKVCGECIAASNLPLLAALGIGVDVMRMAGPPLREVALLVDRRMVRAALPPFDDPECPWGLALGREHLDTLLLNQAAACGVQVYQPWTARAIDGQPGDFRCELRRVHAQEQLSLSAPVLIAAHGSWEPVQATEPDAKLLHQRGDLFAFKANFRDTGLEPGLLPVLSFPGGYGGMVISGEGVATLAFCVRRDVLQRCRQVVAHSKAAQAAATYVEGQCHHLAELLAGASQCGTWLSTGPIRPGIRLPRGPAHVFLIGNAAGEAHPIIGEGMSMAIQSAWLLASTLGPGRSLVTSQAWQRYQQQQYARAWRHHFASRIRIAALFAHAAMRPNWYSAILPLLVRYPSLLTRFSAWSGKVRPAPVMTTGRGPLLKINDRPV